MGCVFLISGFMSLHFLLFMLFCDRNLPFFCWDSLWYEAVVSV